MVNNTIKAAVNAAFLVPFGTSNDKTGTMPFNCSTSYQVHCVPSDTSQYRAVVRM
jgi:hypothetical protein